MLKCRPSVPPDKASAVTAGEQLAAMQAELQKLRVDKRRTRSELTLALEAARV